METLDYPFIWVRKEKEFTWYKRNALKTLWAQASHNNCILHFENGEIFIASLSLKEFHQHVWPSALFRRWHFSFLVRRPDIADCRWKYAILRNGEQVPLSEKGYTKAKSYLHERDLKQ